jgi:hypothetical protein
MREKIRFWWSIAANVWWCLIIGWLVVTLSFYYRWEFPSSGAVLSCCVIKGVEIIKIKKVRIASNNFF